MNGPTLDEQIAWMKLRVAEAERYKDASVIDEQAILASLERLKTIDAQPVPVLLFCPHCGEQHIDAPDADKDWTNPPHRSHECQFCGWVWRPSDTATTGVLKIETQGKVDKPARPRYFQTAADWENAIRSQPVARQGKHNGGDYDMRHTVEQPVPVEPDVIREKRSLVELHGLGGSDKEIIKHIDALLSRIQVAQQERDGKWHRCPSCNNDFKQPFLCTTCGAEKLYDATLQSANQRAEQADALAEQLAEKVKYYESITTGAEHKAVDKAMSAELLKEVGE